MAEEARSKSPSVAARGESLGRAHESQARNTSFANGNRLLEKCLGVSMRKASASEGLELPLPVRERRRPVRRQCVAQTHVVAERQVVPASQAKKGVGREDPPRLVIMKIRAAKHLASTTRDAPAPGRTPSWLAAAPPNTRGPRPAVANEVEARRAREYQTGRPLVQPRHQRGGRSDRMQPKPSEGRASNAQKPERIVGDTAVVESEAEKVGAAVSDHTV